MASHQESSTGWTFWILLWIVVLIVVVLTHPWKIHCVVWLSLTDRLHSAYNTMSSHPCIQDGVNTEVRTVEVTVQDVQNRPPVFSNTQFSAVVRDNTGPVSKSLSITSSLMLHNLDLLLWPCMTLKFAFNTGWAGVTVGSNRWRHTEQETDQIWTHW